MENDVVEINNPHLKELTESELVDRVVELEREVAELRARPYMDYPIYPVAPYRQPDPFAPYTIWRGDTSVSTRFE